MTQKKTKPSKGLHHDNVDAGNPGSPASRTRDVIKRQFEKSRDLTTIEHDATILHDDQDAECGAIPFINLVAALVDDKGPNTEPFATKWLVHDATQIKHVLAATKANAKNLFDVLGRHATVAVISDSSEHKRTLAEAIPIGNEHNPRVLTAFPSDEAAGYDYYGHIEPTVDQGWDDGPHSMSLDRVSQKLDDLLKELHQAHVEKLAGNEGNKVKDLEKSGISILSLDQLIVLP